MFNNVCQPILVVRLIDSVIPIINVICHKTCGAPKKYFVAGIIATSHNLFSTSLSKKF